MKRIFKVGAILAAVSLLVGFSYTLRLECNVAVSGSMQTGLDALRKVVIENGGELVQARSREGSWYTINGVSLTFMPDAQTISIKASVFMGSGCARAKGKERASELFGKLVRQASRESGIEMRMSEVKEVDSRKQGQVLGIGVDGGGGAGDLPRPENLDDRSRHGHLAVPL